VGPPSLLAARGGQRRLGPRVAVVVRDAACRQPVTAAGVRVGARVQEPPHDVHVVVLSITTPKTRGRSALGALLIEAGFSSSTVLRRRAMTSGPSDTAPSYRAVSREQENG